MSATELLLYAMLVTLEARGEPLACQKLIVDTVHSRVLDERWPCTVQTVLSQRGQFPWWKNRLKKYKSVPEIEKVKAVKWLSTYKPREVRLRFWYNPLTVRHDPMKRATAVARCGNHVFKELLTTNDWE